MAADQVVLQLYPCKVCGRRFVQESLPKHQNACVKVSKPRKVFDSSKQRVTEDLPLRQIKNAQKKVIPPPKSNWRAKHEDFINSIRAAREVTKAQSEGKPLPPPPPPSINPDYEQCPYCSRRFNQKAAERHIPFCKEQSMKRGPPPKANTAAAKAKASSKDGIQPPKMKAGATATTSGNRSNVGRAGAADPLHTTYSIFSPSPPAEGLSLNIKKPSVAGCGSNRDSSLNQVNNISSYHMRQQQNPQAGAKNPLSPIGQTSIRTKSGHRSSSRNSLTKHPSNHSSIVPAKFCHNCGTQYCLATAKFCCECGISRIGIS